jgi:hypothetical protein
MVHAPYLIAETKAVRIALWIVRNLDIAGCALPET